MKYNSRTEVRRGGPDAMLPNNQRHNGAITLSNLVFVPTQLVSNFVFQDKTFKIWSL